MTALLFSLAFSAHAGEFGNVHGNPELEAASRQASANALSALEKIILGLRLRELRETSGIEQFRQAADLFSQASNQMLELLEREGFPDRPLSDEEIGLVSNRLQPSELLASVRAAKTTRVLFIEFQAHTARLARIFGQIEDSPRPIFPQISQDLQSYMALAEVVTIINRPR